MSVLREGVYDPLTTTARETANAAIAHFILLHYSTF